MSADDIAYDAEGLWSANDDNEGQETAPPDQDRKKAKLLVLHFIAERRGKDRKRRKS